MFRCLQGLTAACNEWFRVYFFLRAVIFVHYRRCSLFGPTHLGSSDFRHDRSPIVVVIFRMNQLVRQPTWQPERD
jgi:hypothetical protein